MAVAALGIITLLTADAGGGRVVGVLVSLAGAAAAVSGGRIPAAIVLDPEGFALPGARRPRRVAWDEIQAVAALGGWLPRIAFTVRGPRLFTVRLAGQAWPASAILAVLDHYRSAGGRADRRELTTAASVDRFRCP